MTTRIGPIQQDEIKSVFFDFSGEGVAGSIASAVVTVENSRGYDPSPATIVQGSPSINGLVVEQSVRYQVPKAVYLLRCEATDTIGRVHVVAASLQSKRVA